MQIKYRHKTPAQVAESAHPGGCIGNRIDGCLGDDLAQCIGCDQQAEVTQPKAKTADLWLSLDDACEPALQRLRSGECLARSHPGPDRVNRLMTHRCRSLKVKGL